MDTGRQERRDAMDEVSNWRKVEDKRTKRFEKFARKTSKPAEGTTCFNCKEKGHLKWDCVKPKVIDCYRCNEIPEN